MPRSWLLLFACFLSLVGCAPSETHMGGQPVSSRVAKIVSLSPSTTEIVALIGPSNDLFGRGAADNWPDSVRQLPVFGGVKPDYEKIASLNPDLVVLDKSLYSQADLDKFKEIGVKVFAFNAHSIDEFIAQLKEYSILVSAQMAVSQYVDKIESERKNALASAPTPKPKIATLTGGAGTDHLIAGTNGFVADEIRSAGGEPVGPDADKFVPVNPEELIKDDPDIILIAAPITAQNQTPGSKAVAAFRSDPRFKALKAVTKGRVFPVSEDVLLRAGARVDTMIKAIASVVGASE